MASLSKPIELSIPPVVSTVRHGGLPARAANVIVLGKMPPRRARSTSPAISRAYPNVPEATMTGLASTRRPSWTSRSTESGVNGAKPAMNGAQISRAGKHGSSICRAMYRCRRPLISGNGHGWPRERSTSHNGSGARIASRLCARVVRRVLAAAEKSSPHYGRSASSINPPRGK